MDASTVLFLIAFVSAVYCFTAVYWEGRGRTEGYLKYHMDVLTSQGKNPELRKGVSIDINDEKNHLRRLELAKKAVIENVQIPVGGEDGSNQS